MAIERERERERDRQTDRETNKQTNKQTGHNIDNIISVAFSKHSLRVFQARIQREG